MLSKEVLQIVITMFSAQLLWSFEIYDPPALRGNRLDVRNLFLLPNR